MTSDAAASAPRPGRDLPFRDSLRTRLIGAVLVIMLLFGATTGFVVLRQREAQIAADLGNELSATGTLLQDGTIDSFFNDDVAQIRSLLSAALAADSVHRVWALDPGAVSEHCDPAARPRRR